MLTGMRRLSMLVCEGCSSLGALPLTESPLAGLSALTTLKVCHLNRMTYVSDETCRELALLPKVLSSSGASVCLIHITAAVHAFAFSASTE